MGPAVALFVLASVLVPQCLEQPACNPQTLKAYNLVGPVKSVRVEKADTAGGQKTVTRRYVFGRRGRLLEEIFGPLGSSSDHAYQVFRNI